MRNRLKTPGILQLWPIRYVPSGSRPLRAGLLAVCSLLALAAWPPVSPLYAQEAAPPVASAGAVARLALAHELFTLGKARGEALTVLVAARLAASVTRVLRSDLDRHESALAQVRDPDLPDAALPDAALPDTALSDTAQPDTRQPDATGTRPADAAEMFALALGLAGQDAFLAGIIAAARDEALREGATPGPVRSARVASSGIGPGRLHLWQIPLPPGHRAEIAVIGSGAGDLDITVSDAAGIPICFESGPEDILLCAFTPALPGPVQVTIGNRGETAGHYDLITD